MSSIRISTVVPTVADMPLWVRESMVGVKLGINGSTSSPNDSYSVEPESLVHGLRYFGEHPDAKKAADWFELYFKLRKYPLYFRTDWCEYLP